MRHLIILILIFSFAACQQENGGKSENQDKISDTELLFDQEKWKTKEGNDYPYRDSLLNSVLYNDSLRKLKINMILDTLGNPDRKSENYLYYIISQKRLLSWTLHQKTLVFKFTGDGTVDWIKVHE